MKRPLVVCLECDMVVKNKEYHLGVFHNYDQHELALRSEQEPFHEYNLWINSFFRPAKPGEEIYYKNNRRTQKESMD